MRLSHGVAFYFFIVFVVTVVVKPLSICVLTGHLFIIYNYVSLSLAIYRRNN